MSQLYVINSKGEREKFSLQKVYRSVKRAGADSFLAKEIAKTIRREAFPGIKTSEIFKKIKKLLKQQNQRISLRFNLKEGIRKLGPTGFPFEKYIGSIFSEMGYKVKLNLILRGKCCAYEIDFLAEKDDLIYVGECKYRHIAGEKIGSEIALENYARFLDLKNGNYFKKDKRIKSIIVSNAKFTSKAKRYSDCVGVELLGWKYPSGGGLEKIIEERKLYPITILPSFKKELVDIFLSKRKMLARDALNIERMISFIKSNFLRKQLQKIKKEAEILLESA